MHKNSGNVEIYDPNFGIATVKSSDTAKALYGLLKNEYDDKNMKISGIELEFLRDSTKAKSLSL